MSTDVSSDALGSMILKNIYMQKCDFLILNFVYKITES